MNEKIPELSDELTFTALAVPNPHLISIVETEQLKSDIQKQISEKVNSPNELFPDGVNVSFVKSLEHGQYLCKILLNAVLASQMLVEQQCQPLHS